MYDQTKGNLTFINHSPEQKVILHFFYMYGTIYINWCLSRPDIEAESITKS